MQLKALVSSELNDSEALDVIRKRDMSAQVERPREVGLKRARELLEANFLCLLEVQKLSDESTGDVQTGVKILLRALEEPTRQIIHNAGVDEAAVVVREIRAKTGNEGYDASVGEITDMIKAGIIDPAKVTKNALLNSSSIAGLLLTTEALVCEIPDDKKDGGMPPGGGMDGMGGMGGMGGMY